MEGPRIEQAETVLSDADMRRKRSKKRRRWAVICIAIVATLFLGRQFLLSNGLEVTYYHLYSSKMADAENTRIVVLSDLHNREFGEDNVDLIKQIADLQPDIIAVAGDMVNADDENLDIILGLCGKLTKTAPVYYSPGNHESNLIYEKGIPLETLLTEKGVHVLINRAETVAPHKTPFLIGGLATSTEGYEEYGAAFFEEYEKNTAFKLLISHYPSLYYDMLKDAEIDLGVCGHYHGGQIRLPLIGGLYHGDTGFFPKYSGGMYDLPHGTLFVSRGMGGHNAFPRINNRPELAVIDINGWQETHFP